MSIPRRSFLKTGIMVAAFSAIPLRQAMAGNQPGGPKKTSAKTGSNALNYFNMSTFTPYVNTKFRVELSAASAVTLTLMTVEDLLMSSGQRSAVSGECFSLRFTGPTTKLFKQDTYKLEHPALGTFSMFIVPISQRAGSGVMHYEAIVNRCLG